MSNDERIFEFHVLANHTLEELVKAFNQKAIIKSITPLTEGMSTSNYVVQLEGNTKKYVLRIYPFNNDHSQLEISAYNYAKTTIHVPEIYFFDNSKKIIPIINCNADLVEQIASKHVFSHGDFIFSNIIVTPSLQTFFIDYEYCFSAPVFYDIGKFFRTRTNVERYIGTETISAFFDGYNSKAKEPLPKEWYIYSKIADVATMLHLINKPIIPEGWGLAIDSEIVKTLDLLPD